MADTQPALPLGHTPVMAREACDWLVWREDGLYVDATLGAAAIPP